MLKLRRLMNTTGLQDSVLEENTLMMSTSLPPKTPTDPASSTPNLDLNLFPTTTMTQTTATCTMYSERWVHNSVSLPHPAANGFQKIRQHVINIEKIY